ncbi:MAG: V-type ATP synthase subunit F [Candidatus Hydrogenedentes bacterium]|nr:V-type ATP synthase subunit F [Candidatus Hydrogenedentota bacterium]
MNIFVIGDNDTVLGFRLAGVRGSVVGEKDDAALALENALRDASNGLVLVTESIAHMVRERVDMHRASAGMPIVLEIPGASGPSASRVPIGDIVRKAVGVSV